MRKELVCLVLVFTLVVAQVQPVFAGTDTYNRSGSGVCYGASTSNRVHLNVNTELEVHTTWYAFGHWVKSNGKSVLVAKPVKGCKANMTSHTMEAKVSGISVDLSFTNASKISENSKSVKLEVDTESWGYSIEADCKSLKGYKEIHTGEYEFSKYNGKTYKKVDTVTVSASVKYGAV